MLIVILARVVAKASSWWSALLPGIINQSITRYLEEMQDLWKSYQLVRYDSSDINNSPEGMNKQVEATVETIIKFKYLAVQFFSH